MNEALTLCVAGLLSSGHALADVRRYTFRQGYALLTLSLQRKKEEAYNFVLLSRAAFWAESNRLKELTDDLREEDDGR